MSTTSIGHAAEQAAAAYLIRKGYRIVEHNWRTRWCEIDLIVTKGDAVSFVEVKYRRQSTWGRGLEYITRAKHQQMCFAAEFWIARNKWYGPCYLSAVEVQGPRFAVTAFIPEL